MTGDSYALPEDYDKVQALGIEDIGLEFMVSFSQEDSTQWLQLMLVKIDQTVGLEPNLLRYWFQSRTHATGHVFVLSLDRVRRLKKEDTRSVMSRPPVGFFDETTPEEREAFYKKKIR